ncbi:MAG: MATE family efflux transporter [Prevotellaceae bacterium]|jgi:putative MATE family efflux protein|nr:MATE family efflux transporter [Prevotellaceae bacterium]
MKDFTQGKILPQLVKLALPIMGTGLAQLAYNFADIIWLGRLSSQAVAAASIAGFVAWITYSIALVTKVGVEVCIAQAIGQRSLLSVKHIAAHALTISAIMSLLTLGGLLALNESIVGLFGLEAEVQQQCADYIEVLAWCMPVWFFNPTFSGIYNGAGNSRTPFVVSTIGIVVNIVLDPFFIFGVGALPALGVRGAALSTGIAVVVEFGIFVALLLRPSTAPFSGFRFFSPLKRNLSRRLLKVGAPAALQSALFALFTMVVSAIAASVGGHVGVAVQGAGSQIESLSWITANGVSTALGAYVGQNYGARQLSRVVKSFAAGVGIVSVFGMVVGGSFVAFGREIFALFVPSDAAVVSEGGRYLFILGISQLFLCAEIATTGAFNGLGRSAYPAAVSIALNALRIPLALVLSRHAGLAGIWWAICISTVLKGTILAGSFPLLMKRLKKSFGR